MYRIYYHHYVPKDDKSWIFTFLDQLKVIEDSSLFDIIEKMKIFFFADEDSIRIAQTYSSEYPKIEFITNPISSYVDERFTLRQIWLDSHYDDFSILYLHNKGSTYFQRYIENSTSVHPEQFKLFRNIFYWRKYLEWGCIEQWKKCVDSLAQNEIAGVNYNEHPFKHYSGNFWWARSDYIKKLDDPLDSEWWRQVKNSLEDRFCSEFWCLHKAERIFNLHDPGKHLQFPNHGVYSIPYKRNFYYEGDYP